MTDTRQTVERERGKSLYELGLSTSRQRLNGAIAVVGLLVSLLVGVLTEPPTAWGLLPIALYAALSILGMDLVITTAVAFLSGVLVVMASPAQVGKIMGDAVGDSITVIGMVIVLGAGLGELLRQTGVAEQIVRAIMRVTGRDNRTAVLMGVLLASLVLVTSTGTLAGSVAIVAPIVLPICARVGYTRSATAAMLFIGGCAGLTLAPFAGSNIAITDAAGVSYGTYLKVGALPLALLSLVMAMILVPWVQRRSATRDDFYEAELVSPPASTLGKRTSRATVVFLVLLVVTSAYATITQAGTAFPLLALPVLSVATGLAGGLTLTEVFGAIYRGAGGLFSMFILFWLLAALFATQNLAKPFDVVLSTYQDEFQNLHGLTFALAIALIGWVGVPGATAAQVTLVDKVFGPMADSLGVSAAGWVIVLLWASKGDTYGPFPNANMVGPMGFARSGALRTQLLVGWAVMIAASVMYTVLLAVVI
jgi:H+/gluconate symporter-like permease